MSKIVIDARESGTSSGRYVDKLVEHLYKLRPEHTIILLAKAERMKYLSEIAPSFVTVETPYKEFTFGEQLGLRKQVKDLEPDLVHFTFVQQPVWYRGKVVTTMQDLTTIRFKNPTKNPVVFWVKQQAYKWVNKRVAHKSVAIITPTQFVKDDVANYTHIKPAKITVTYEAADNITDEPVPVESVGDKQFIMYLGRPTPHKNLSRLIDAFRLLQKARPELYLVLVGKKDANYRLHEARVQAEGIANVIFTDFVSDAQLRWLYGRCLAYVFPSLSEGFGLPAMEAMVHGAAVVSSNATCLPEVYGNAVSYFNPLDVSDMAAKIGEVVDDPLVRDDLRERGRRQAAGYSWDRMAQQTLAVYEKALKHN